MSDENNLDQEEQNEIENVKVASIDFFYDGLTNTPRMSLNKIVNDPTSVDILTLYSFAALEVLEEHYVEVQEKLEEIVGTPANEFKTEYSVH